VSPPGDPSPAGSQSRQDRELDRKQEKVGLIRSLNLGMEMDTRLMAKTEPIIEPGIDAPGQAAPAGGPSLTDEDLRRAEQILKLVAADPQPSRAVGNHLDEILGLLPAILSVNIRQANREGRADLVHSLEVLRDEYMPHLEEAADAGQDQNPWKTSLSSQQARILMVGPDDKSIDHRLRFPAAALESMGCEISITSDFPEERVREFDVVVVSRPHLRPDYLRGMAVCRTCNVPVVIDIDADYQSIPLKHPDYDELCLFNQDISRAYTTSIILADQVLAPSRELVNLLRTEGLTTFYAPPGWNKGNPLWSKPAPQRHTINIGWLGYPGQAEDIAPIRRMLTRLTRQVPQVKIIIGSNPAVYHLFNNLPDSRKLYLPPSRADDFPYLLSQIDILVSPLRNIPFNKSLSDQVLMEAGARSIPWIASPIPSYLDWKSGGLFAHNKEEWYSQLYQLVINPDLRKQLGQEGYQKAKEREIRQLAPIYKDLIDLIRWSKTTGSETEKPHKESH